VGLMTPPRKNLLLGDQRGCQDPHRVVAPVKKKNDVTITGFSGLLLSSSVLNKAEYPARQYRVSAALAVFLGSALGFV
jgi:hypothetical protein